MADAGFFKGTSAEQDSRFANKQKKLLKEMKFPDNIETKVIFCVFFCRRNIIFRLFL